MLVGVNALNMPPGLAGGEEHYLRNVLATIRKVQPDLGFVLFTDAENDRSFEGWEHVCVESGALGRLAGADAPLERAVKRAGADLLFTPLQTALSKTAVPQVIFTLSLLEIEQLMAKPRRRDAAQLKVLRRTCAKAAALITPSQFLQRKCLEVLDVPLDRVVVAPLGIAPAFDQPQACIAQQPYFLVVGGTRECRNIPRLRDAFTKLAEEFPHTLVVVGQPREAEPDDWGPRAVRVDRCPTAHLAGLYQHCDVFLCPSLYEGSGVVVLEAMRAGAPVATSRVGGIPEVAGDIPIYFNPENVGTITGAVRRLLEENPKDRERRIHFGKQLASEFTWENCAWRTLAAFRRVVQ